MRLRPMALRENADLGPSDRDKEDGRSPSISVIVARRDEDFGPLTWALRGFIPVRESIAPRWTDDRADLLRAMRRNEE